MASCRPLFRREGRLPEELPAVKVFRFILARGTQVLAPRPPPPKSHLPLGPMLGP